MESHLFVRFGVVVNKGYHYQSERNINKNNQMNSKQVTTKMLVTF